MFFGGFETEFSRNPGFGYCERLECTTSGTFELALKEHDKADCAKGGPGRAGARPYSTVYHRPKLHISMKLH